MTTPRRQVAPASPSPTGARAEVSTSTELEAEHVMLNVLRCSGVGGLCGLAALMAAGELLAAVRASDPPDQVDFSVAAGPATVHVEIDVTGLDGLDETAIESEAFPGARWGTLRERGRAALWAEVDRASGERDPDRADDPIDPIELLFDVATRLSRARTLADVAAIVHGPLREQLGADAAALAIRNAGTIRLVDPGSSEGLHRPGSDIGHPEEFSIGSELPIAASIRDAEYRFYADTRLLGHDPRAVGARSRAEADDALAIVPVTVAGRPIGALAVGWRGTRPVEWLRPLLVIVAKYSADAANRVLSPPPGVTAMRPGGPRAPGSRDRATTAIGALRIDVVSRRVFLPGREPVRLTGREFELLLYLGEHVGTVQSRLQTLREVWGIGFRADTSVVDVTVSRLRRKLGQELIVTVRDQGYMLLA